MPKVLAQSNLPNSAAVVVSSETIILRDPNNSILEKYTSDEQRQKALNSYGIKPESLLSPGENKIDPRPKPPIILPDFEFQNGNELLPYIVNPPYDVEEITTRVQAGVNLNPSANVWLGAETDESLKSVSLSNRFVTDYFAVQPGMFISFTSVVNTNNQPTAVFLDENKLPLAPNQCIYGTDASNHIVPDGASYIVFQTYALDVNMHIKASHKASLFTFSNINNQNLDENG